MGEWAIFTKGVLFFAKNSADDGFLFDYLYNRHVAQICYCGEPNCVGTIGGKTQTDIGGMDDLYIDGETAFIQTSGCHETG